MFTSRSTALVFAVSSLLVTIACGADVPAKPDAAAAVSKAIASTLKRTLPSLTYCMTANPDFSFATTGQVDLVEMFRNLSNKDALNDAVKAGAVHIDLKEFRFDPAGRSPDPACDEVQAQSKQSGFQRDQVRLAMVRTTLTDKGKAAGVQLGASIDVATRELVDVTEIKSQGGGFTAVKYTWKWTPTTMAAAIGYEPAALQEATARLKRTGGNWVVDDAGVKR